MRADLPPPNTRILRLTLDQLPPRQTATIRHVHVPAGDDGRLRRRLLELGFVPGERVNFFGRGPLAVRVGTSTFAMRKLESSLIEVETH